MELKGEERADVEAGQTATNNTAITKLRR